MTGPPRRGRGGGSLLAYMRRSHLLYKRRFIYCAPDVCPHQEEEFSRRATEGAEGHAAVRASAMASIAIVRSWVWVAAPDAQPNESLPIGAPRRLPEPGTASVA